MGPQKKKPDYLASQHTLITIYTAISNVRQVIFSVWPVVGLAQCNTPVTLAAWSCSLQLQACPNYAYFGCHGILCKHAHMAKAE